jgi:hypothetical protein
MISRRFSMMGMLCVMLVASPVLAAAAVKTVDGKG